MSLRFEFATASRVCFGARAMRQVNTVARTLGTRALVLHGRKSGQLEQLLMLLRTAGVSVERLQVSGEPTVAKAVEVTEHARELDRDLLLGFGGGSIIDLAKAVAALTPNPRDPLDYLEVVGKGLPFAVDPFPVVAIPTTAGTGSEVTRNAVLAVPEQRIKVSMRHPRMLPALALVDPPLTWSLPPDLTASTGLDALAQLIEPYVSQRPNPLTDGFCQEGIRCVARFLRQACEDGRNSLARERMALASLLGGLALANGALGAVHGLAGPLGGMLGAPHGALCGALLPHVMAVNVQALRTRKPDDPSLARYETVARLLTGVESAQALDAVAWVEELCGELQLPGLAAHGLTDDEVPLVIEKARVASSMQGNPILLEDDELTEILTRAR